MLKAKGKGKEEIRTNNRESLVKEPIVKIKNNEKEMQETEEINKKINEIIKEIIKEEDKLPEEIKKEVKELKRIMLKAKGKEEIRTNNRELLVKEPIIKMKSNEKEMQDTEEINRKINEIIKEIIKEEDKLPEEIKKEVKELRRIMLKAKGKEEIRTNNRELLVKEPIVKVKSNEKEMQKTEEINKKINEIIKEIIKEEDKLPEG
ncbi:hypothetical protein [Marinitoga lauensis]|uniref:hypothetical protein n=1 Tax=Marinitoga lauensis TaxID=2201189 RepID=UPI0010124D46|nr:hypothetical protein [Marinitoga lauensis]